MGSIERVKRVDVLPPQVFQRYGLTLGIVDQPILVMFVDPGTAAYFEGRGPQAQSKTVSDNAMGHKPHAVGELVRVGGDELSAGVLVAVVNLEIVVAERIQMLRQPIRVSQRFALVDGCVISGPTPPSHGNLARYTGAMQTPNRRTVRQKLRMVVLSYGEHYSFGAKFFAWIQGET